MNMQTDMPPAESCAPPPSANEATRDEFDLLVQALRYPQVVFGDSAEPDLIARCEMADWQASAASLRQVLRQHGVPPAEALAMLRLAGEFLQLHRIRLQGSPWLCTFETDEGAWIRYDIHTSLDPAHVSTWDDRFDDVLMKRRLDRDRFYLRLLSSGPR